jgi:branched-chain amino acid aminotransferase
MDITHEMLLNADEAFFTGTASEITPISSVDDSSIGNGKPGEITLKLKNLYWDIIHGKVSQYTHWLSPIQCAKNLTPSVAE